MLVTFGGKHEHREAETIDVEEYIGKKGLQAKGKKVSQHEVKKAEFTEPLHKPEDDEPQENSSYISGDGMQEDDMQENTAGEDSGAADPTLF